MKRKLVTLTLFICLFSHQTFAQWGIKGGVNQSKYTTLFDIRYKTGFHIGVIYDKEIGKISYIQTGLSFISHGTNFTENSDYNREKSYIDMYGLELPLLVSCRPHIAKDTRLIFDAGPFFRYGLFGNTNYVFKDFHDPTIFYDYKAPTFDGYRRFDLGVNLGVGVRHKNYTTSVSYLHGLNRLEKNLSSFNRMWRVNLIYSF